MNDEQKFKAILQRAMDNGWNDVYKYSLMDWSPVAFQENQHFAIIFSKDFAKAYWGEKEWAFISGYNEWGEITEYWENSEELTPLRLKAYEYHLQQLVLQDNYIDYLYSFIKEGQS